MKDMKARSITLMLTNNCNLNCTYCYETCKTNKIMDLKFAKDVIKREIGKEDGFDTLVIEFFGGEPFLEFENLKALVEYIYSLETKKTIYCFTTTNGTLVHGDIQDWLASNKDKIRCGLSLDGTEKMHDVNRSQSYNDIDKDFFRRTWPDQPVKMTISPESLGDMAEGVMHLHGMGFNVDCNLAYGIDWSLTDYRKALTEQLKVLIDYYLENPGIKPCSMLNVSMEKIKEADNDSQRIKLCGTGTRMKVYDCDGKKYPCQYFLPSSMENTILIDTAAFKDKFDACNLPMKCVQCCIYNVCPNCYGANYQERGNVFLNSQTNCDVAVLTAKATAYLMYRKYDKKLMPEMSSDDEYRLFRGIELVQKLDYKY